LHSKFIQGSQFLSERWGSRSPSDTLPCHKKIFIQNSTREFHFYLREGFLSLIMDKKIPLSRLRRAISFLSLRGASRSPLGSLFHHAQFPIQYPTTELNFYLREGGLGAPLILSPLIENSAFNTQPRNLIFISERGFGLPPCRSLRSSRIQNSTLKHAI
jgi:hypothetical protein